MSEDPGDADDSSDPDDETYDLDSGPDPADYAASAPEPVRESADDDDERKSHDHPSVHAVGIGPGNPEYLIPRAERAIREADVVVGFETVVEFIRDLTDADLLTCGYRDEATALSTFAERVAAGDRGTAVLMGDPNHSGYQFLGKVERAIDEATAGADVDGDGSAVADGDAGADVDGDGSAVADGDAGAVADGDAGADVDVRILPGISSLQVAASRARTPMEASTFVTLHKSGDLTDDLDRLRRDVGERHLLVLPRPFDLMPGDIAADLLEHGGRPDATALVCERLTHDDEAITHTTLGDLASHAGGDRPADSPFSDLSVLVVRR